MILLDSFLRLKEHPSNIYMVLIFCGTVLLLLLGALTKSINSPLKWFWYLFLMVIAFMTLGFFVDRGKDSIKNWFDK